MKKYGCVFLTGFMMSCASKVAVPLPAVAEVNSEPVWIDALPPADELWGIGFARWPDEYTAIKAAESDGRASLLLLIDHCVQALFVEYDAAAETPAAEALKEDVYYEISRMELAGAAPNIRWKSPGGVWWYRLQYPKAAVKAALVQLFESESGTHAGFNANVAIQLIDQPLSRTYPPLRTGDK
jgi:hypothetical protein